MGKNRHKQCRGFFRKEKGESLSFKASLIFPIRVLTNCSKSLLFGIIKMKANKMFQITGTHNLPTV